MKVAVDISLYPLDADFIPPIKNGSYFNRCKWMFDIRIYFRWFCCKPWLGSDFIVY